MHHLTYNYLTNFFPYVYIRQLKLINKKYKFPVKQIYTDRYGHCGYFTEVYAVNSVYLAVVLRRKKLIRYKIDKKKWKIKFIVSMAIYHGIFDVYLPLLPLVKQYTITINYAISEKEVDTILENENIFAISPEFISVMLERKLFDVLKYFLTKRPQSIFATKWHEKFTSTLSLDIVNFFYDNKISYNIEELIYYFRHMRRTDVYQVLIKQLIWQNGS